MIRRAVLILVCAVLLAPAFAWAQDGKAFLGDWVLTVEGRRGPQERPLSIKETGGKMTAELGGGRGGPSPSPTSPSRAPSDPEVEPGRRSRAPSTS